MAYNNFWIKLYYEILTDPKMGGMDDHTWRRTIELFLLAGSEGEDGYLPPIADIAWHLRTSEEDIEQVLARLEQLHIIAKTDQGYVVANYAKRQKSIEPKERMQSLRNRKSSEEYYSSTYFQDSVTSHQDSVTSHQDSVTTRNDNSYDDVTSRKTDIDIDIDRDRDLDQSAAAASNDAEFGEIFKVYEQEIGALTPFVREEMLDAVDHYPRDWILDAIRESAKSNARNWKYTLAILKRWKAEGRDAQKSKSGARLEESRLDEFRKLYQKQGT